MVLGADGAYYANAAAAAAGAKASAEGVFASTPDDQNAIFGNFGGDTSGSGLPSTLDLGSTFSDSTGTPTVLGQPSKAALAFSAFSSTLFHPLDSLKGLLDPAQASKNVAADDTSASGLDAIGKFFTAISDVPRDATVIIGLALIIIGVFALSKGPAVNIVSSAVRGAVTS